MKSEHTITKAFVLLLVLVLISSLALADSQPLETQPVEINQQAAPAEPSLSDIIPQATNLSVRLETFENEVANFLDISAVQKKYAGIEENLKVPDDQLQRLKASRDYSYTKLLELRQLIEKQNKLFAEISLPLNKAIGQLGDWRKAWMAEKKRWHEWRSLMLEEGGIDQLQSTFANADAAIDKALHLVHTQLEAMLTVQKQASYIQVKINTLTTELDGLIQDKQRSVLLEKSPPMFSSYYVSQFGSEMRSSFYKGLYQIEWPDKRLLDEDGWILLIQGFISLTIIITIYRNRETLQDLKRWRFLATRPVSAGLFVGYMMTVFIYEYWGSVTWKLALVIVGGISFARLSAGVIEASWKKQFVTGVVIIIILTRLMYTINLPIPLFRLYTVFMALAGILFCLRWTGESIRLKDPGFYAWSLRFAGLFLLVILVTELLGKEALAEYLFLSLQRSIAVVLIFTLFMHMIHGVLEWVFLGSPLQRITVLHSDADEIIRRMGFFIDAAIWGLILLPAILMIFGVFNTLEEATKGLMSLGFKLGSLRVSVGNLLIAAGVIYGSFLASWLQQKLIMDECLIKRQVERGVRLSIGRLIHYILIFAGFILALVVLGFEFTKLTIMLSALGVGIGFGLQGVVNNFVSGLILLFEQPVRVGDIIELGGIWVEIKKIGLRATIVQTYDQSDMIIPNADLVSNQVTNWTLSNRQVRLIIPIGVAYGSDVSLVKETLMASADAHEKVAKTRRPQVLFLSFGESSLDFELRVWVFADERLQVKSDLHEEIDRRFREAKIEISFPQRDLHLRSIDESIQFMASEHNK